jgi:hypothetical protein
MVYQVRGEPQFIRIRFFGKVTRSELLAALDEMEVLEASAATMPHRLTDLTDVELSEVKAVDIHAAAEKRSRRRFANRFRSAVVAPQPVQFGYARMFQVLNQHPDISIQIFADIATATAWLASESVMR